MEILYLISIIILAISFFSFKKSDKKLNIIKWIMIFIIALYGYNIAICMFLGILNIKSYLWLLSIINLIVSYFIGWKSFKNKEFQKYTVKKENVIGFIVLIAILSIIVFKEIRPQDGGIEHVAVDSAIHYRIAKMFSDNLMIPINCENKTIFNFSFMQTGSAINNGLLMNVVNGLFGIDECYIYDFFEVATFILTGIAFYTIIMDKINGKLGFVLTMILMWLYVFAYPYNSYLWGFSYLSLGILFIHGIIIVLNNLYDENNINTKIGIVLTSIMSMGLIFSYCLFAPMVFLAIVVYIFVKEYTQDSKKYIKFFTKNTLILIILLFIISMFGIGYLVVPTFLIKDQTNLYDALSNSGGFYYSLYENLNIYVIFAIIYIIDLIIKIKNKTYKFNFKDILAWTFVVFFAVIWIGKKKEIISVYYFSKLFYVLWPIVFMITIEILNEYINKKVFRIILPIYLLIWFGLVVYTIVFKAGAITKKWQISNIDNYVGMYFDENYDKKGWVYATLNLNKLQCEILNEAYKIDGLTVENVELISSDIYDRIWALAIANLESETISYNTFVNNNAINENIAEEKMYIINIEKNDLEEKVYENFEVVFENEQGYILQRKY